MTSVGDRCVHVPLGCGEFDNHNAMIPTTLNTKGVPLRPATSGDLMPPRNYWLDLFTGTTWNEFLDSGAHVSGFRDTRWSTVQRIKPGDFLLCYLTGLSRWVGLLEVTSDPYWDETMLWKDEVFPCRLKVTPIISLTPETAVPVHDLRDELSMFQDLQSPLAWTGRFRGSPSGWSASDGEAVIRALKDARANPVHRAVDPRKLARRPRSIGTKLGPVIVPEYEDPSDNDPQAVQDLGSKVDQSSPHTHIQWLLLKLGNDLGLDVWAARNDRGREYEGFRFKDLPRMKQNLPLQFDEATSRTVELIDVLWLTGNTIVAAFEIESTTSIYSGLLRMSDLIAMQPNLKIPLFLVAPDDRRDKVISEVNRPTFSRLSPPMKDICSFIAFSDLESKIAEISPWVRYMKPDLLNEIAESCDVEEP